MPKQDDTFLVHVWYLFLRLVAVFNVSALLYLAFVRVDGVNRKQLALSSLYVLGCAFRSFFPRADLQRIAIVHHWLSAVFYGFRSQLWIMMRNVVFNASLVPVVGRLVATIAEIAYAVQLALFFEISVIAPMLVLAEFFSWYAIVVDW
jgi:hypothetical protein